LFSLHTIVISIPYVWDHLGFCEIVLYRYFSSSSKT